MSGLRDGPTKVSRPINDKAYKEKSSNALIEFLINCDYPFPISNKLLQSPQSKDFLHMFEFLYGFLEPNYKCQGRIEEEIPKILKLLGYPIPIARSTLQAVGSSHSWPILLGALTWLREMVEFMKNTDIDTIIFPYSANDDFDGIAEAKLVYAYCESTYNLFLEGADSFDEQEAELSNNLRQQGGEADGENLKADNRRLREELASLKKQANPLHQLRDQLSTLKVDHEKMNAFATNLSSHLQFLEKQNTEEEARQRELDVELEVVQLDIQKKRHTLAAQELSTLDVQRMKRERQELQGKIEAKEQEIHDISKSTWEEELAIGKGQAEIDKKVAEYNRTAQLLQLIPVTAANASNIDFQMQSSLLQTSSSHWHNTVKPALNKVKKQMMENVLELEEDVFSEQDILSQLNEQIAEQEDNLKQSDDEMFRLDQELETQKKTQQHQIADLQEKMAEKHRAITALKQQQDEDMCDIRALVTAANLKLEQMRRDFKEEENKYAEHLTQTCLMIMDHKASIQERLSQAVDNAKARATKGKPKAT
nr:proteasome subunit alpha type-3 [Arenicola marina]